MSINWYPGHMAKAKRQLSDQVAKADVIVELCDARVPQASRNPALQRLLSGKRRLLVLGKADLAEESETRAWLRYYRAQGEDCLSFDSVRGRAKDIVSRAQAACSGEIERMAEMLQISQAKVAGCIIL